MDRQIVYPGAIPLDTDVLGAQQDGMIALGWLVQTVLGTSTWLVGLPCAPTAPPSMAVTIGEGMITGFTEVDAAGFGSLPTNTAALVKAGINLNSTSFTLTAPTISGDSINYLIEGEFQEVDNTPVVLPYVNATNPLAPYSGPANSGTAQNTKRAQIVGLQLKAGAPAPTGTQTTPAVDAGWVPMYVVTVNFGQTTITSGSIVVAPNAPFLPDGSIKGYIDAVSGALSPPIPMAYAGGGGGPITTSQIVLQEPVLGPLAFSLNFGATGTFKGAVGYLSTPPTAAMVFSIQQNGIQVGTMNFAAGANFATFTASPAPSFIRNDILTIVAPVTADATAAGLSCTIWGQM